MGTSQSGLKTKKTKRMETDVLAYERIGHVTDIIIYPVKSCKGISLKSANCLTEGLQSDRRWIVVDKDGMPIRPFEKPALAQVTPHFEDDKLCLNAPGMDALKVNLYLDTKETREIKVLRISSISQYAGDEAAAWFSTFLDTPGCKMYKIQEPRRSIEHKNWGVTALPRDKMGYAGFTAYHMTTEASLEALNQALSSPIRIRMDRFRPNIVIGGTKPYAEDQWTYKILKIADVKFRKLKDCERCVQTTVDPETGAKDGLEPLATLRRTRLFKDRDPTNTYAPYFGVQMASDCEGTIKLGDPVFISC